MKDNVYQMKPYEWTQLILLSILWGGSFFFIDVAVQDLPILTIISLRLLLASLALIAVVHFSGLKMERRPSVWLCFLGMGILNNAIPFTLIVWGQTYIGCGLAAILNGTTPIFTVVAAHLLTRDEKLTRQKIAGALIGFSGVVVIIGPEALSGIKQNIMPQLAVLGAAFSYAMAGIFGRRFKTLGVKPIVTASGQVIASTCLLLPLAIIIDQPFTLAPPRLEVLLAIVALALLSTTLAYILYFRILSIAGATNVLLVTLLIPVSAILLGVLILGEQLEVKHLTGMGLIALGLLSIDGRLYRKIPRRAEIRHNITG